jgi:GT2 family glycosyltransferase
VKKIHFSIIIVSLNGEKVLPTCMKALYKTDWDNFEVILVDNGSEDRTSGVVREGWKDVKIIRAPRNFGFAGGNNLGIKEAKGDWIVLLNDDTEVKPGWLKAFNSCSEKYPEAGILGCKLLYPGGNIIQHAGGIIEANGLTKHIGYEEEDKGQFDEIKDYPYVTGAAFAISRKVIEKSGVLDKNFFPIYFEEIDYCARVIRDGFRVLYVPEAVVIHHESRTTGKFSPGFLYKYHRNRYRFLLKNRSIIGLLKALKHEIKWLVQNKPKDSYIPLIKSCLYILPRIPFILIARFIQ